MNTDVFENHGRRRRNRRGWSLIEVIATIVVAGILVTLMLPLIGSGIEGSRRGLLRLPTTYSLRADMDAWWHLYRTVYATDLPGLRTAINDAATTDPAPPYQLLENKWVQFDAAGLESDAPAGTEDVLRVTLGNATGERLSAIFFPIP